MKKLKVYYKFGLLIFSCLVHFLVSQAMYIHVRATFILILNEESSTYMYVYVDTLSLRTSITLCCVAGMYISDYWDLQLFR